MPSAPIKPTFEAKDYVPTSVDVRVLIASYFNKTFDSKNIQHIKSYFCKIAEMGAIDALHVYRKHDGKPPETLKNDYPLYPQIFEGQEGKKSVYCVHLIRYLAYLAYMTLKAGVLSLLTSTSPIKADCLYLRKKDYHDLGLGQLLLDKLTTKNKKVVLSFFTRKKSAHGYETLNNQRGATLHALMTFVSLMKHAPMLVGILHQNAIPKHMFKRFVVDCYLAVFINRLKPKVITGVLLDKPLYVLIDYFKVAPTKTISLNESFLYPPFRTFDYNHLDMYLGTSDFESQYLNLHGGKIHKISHISFIRKSLKQNSYGLTPELTEKIDSFRKVILACTVQTEHDSLWYFSVTELENFVLGMIDAAKKNPEYLFILKEKKGELSYIDNALKDRLNAHDNIYIESSVKPRLNKYNQFEDIIKKTDLCVSMNHGSTVLYQALSVGIPVIAINDAHPDSFLTQYDIIEMTSDAMANGINAWFTLSNQHVKSVITTICDDIGLGDKDGFKQAAEIIETHL